jgi:hypothetical protein
MGLFDIRLWIYPGKSPDADASDWGLEEDVSAYIRHPGDDGGQVIHYSGGKGDEAPGVDASQMTLTLDNRDGRFSTDNILGPYYGDLDLSTPIRMGVVAWTDAFTRSTSNGWGTVDASLGKIWTVTGTASNWNTDGAKGNVIIPAANSAVGARPINSDASDVDVTMTVIPTAVATGARFAAGVQVRRSAFNSYVQATLGFDVAGALKLDIARWVVGVSTSLAGTITLGSTYSAGQRWRMRVQADGGTIRVKVWAEAGSEPATWDLTAAETLATGREISVYLARFSGNTNSGATTIMSVDDFQTIALEFTGAVVAWPVRWDMSGNNSWAPIVAAGILRRITQGTYPLMSPLRRQLAGTPTVVGYWPLEDGEDSRAFSSVIPRQQPATYSSATPAQATDLPGGLQAPVLTAADGYIRGQTSMANTGTGFAAMFYFKIGTLPATKTRIARFRSSGPVPIWDFSIDSGGYVTEGLSGDGTVLTSASSGLPPIDFNNWVGFQLETDNTTSPGNTTWESFLQEVGVETYWYQTSTEPGSTVSLIKSFWFTGPSGTAFAHVWLGSNSLPFVSTEFNSVSSGYARELAADRFGRVCMEAGIPYIVRAGDSEPMGAQREGGTLAVLKSCEAADYGVLSERGPGLEYIPRSARWNAAVTLAITVASGQVAQAPQPTRDDQRLRNKWTVSRTGGGQAVGQDDESVAKHGSWEDSATINVADDTVLENHAVWRAYLGSQTLMRWPSVALNFARNPTLLPYWRARAYGWRIQITTGKAQVQGNEPDLIVEGFQADLWPDGWTADLNCSSARPWVAAVADDTGILGRVDTDGCQTTALITSTALTIPITTTTGFPRWDNTAGLWTGGVGMYVGGEKVTVTSITNGVGQAQTLNCSARGVAGYAFAHPSGTEVRLWDPAIVAL